MREGSRVCLECGEFINARVASGALAVEVPLWMQAEERRDPRRTYSALPGSFVLRVIAELIDEALAAGIFVGLVLLSLQLNGTDRTLQHFFDAAISFAIPFTIGEFVVFSLMLASNLRATPGKLATGLVVGDQEGAPLGLFHAMWRSFIKSALMRFFPLEVLVALVVDDNQTVHDMIAGTNVYSR